MVSWLLTDKNTTQKRMQVWKKSKISIEPAINEMLASEEDRWVTDKNPEILLMGVFSPLRVLIFPVFGGTGVALTPALCSLLQYINYCLLLRENSLFTCIQSKKLPLCFCEEAQQKQIDEQGSTEIP